MKPFILTRGLSFNNMFEKPLVRIFFTILSIYILLLYNIPLLDNKYLITKYDHNSNTMASILMLIISIILYVLTLYTVFAQEENDLISHKKNILELLNSCKNKDISAEAQALLKIIDETLYSASSTWIRWATYELPFAYALVLPLTFVIYLYSTSQSNYVFTTFLPNHLSWGKILAVFAMITLISGVALAYVFRKGYERKILRLYAESTTCLV